MMVRELGFEMKAQPSNRMKTEEELAKEEQEKLRKLEVHTGDLSLSGWPSWIPRRLSSLTGGLCASDSRL